MTRISAYFISFLCFIINFPASSQDSIRIPMKIRIGADIPGPVYYFTDRNQLSIEGFVSVDLDEKKAAVIEAGYLDYKYSQYNYNYSSKGIFIRAGMDFNLIQPEMVMGKYYAGIGLRYGLSIYSSEVPFFKHDNYWGTVSDSIPSATHLGHFFEATPGIRTELFKNFSIGWTIRLRILIHPGTSKDQRPVCFPGFGNGAKSFSPGINYYFIWSIPYKEKTVKLKEELTSEG